MYSLNVNYFNKIGTKAGALNPCILGNGASTSEDFNVLPNCVGFTTGLFNQIHGQTYCRYFGSVDATNFYNLGISQGLYGTTDPRATIIPGCVLIWGGYGSHSAGHCAVVERVIDSNNLYIAESGWNGSSKYWNQSYWLSGNMWTCSWMGTSNYFFKGIIYPPGYTPTPPHPPSTIETKHFNWLFVTRKKRTKLSRY